MFKAPENLRVLKGYLATTEANGNNGVVRQPVGVGGGVQARWAGFSMKMRKRKWKHRRRDKCLRPTFIYKRKRLWVFVAPGGFGDLPLHRYSSFVYIPPDPSKAQYA